MRISQIYRPQSLGISIEIFPPKTSEGDAALFGHLERLIQYRPSFVSCTYGAGGSTQHRTVELCRTIQQRFQVPATAHFTCVGSDRQQLVDWLRYAHAEGIRNIMALRGDPPKGATEFQAVAGGLKHANELVALIRGEFPEMGIGVAGYPEKHPEAADLDVDLANLQRKVAAGADAVFTQLFFVNQNFFDFQARCRALGITQPIIPGIMPITEFARIKRITAMCGAIIPDDLAARLEDVQDDAAAQFEIGVDHATRQCRELIDAGVPGIHFYVLNKSEACERILDGLGLSTAVA